MKKINIITPFSRDQNLAEYLQFIQKMSNYVNWIPVCTPNKKALFDTSVDALQLNHIVSPVYVEEVPGVDICYYKINKALDSIDFSNTLNDYYAFMMDDDYYESNVFEEILKHTEDVVFISMKRGHQIPNDGQIPHDVTSLWAVPENIRVCSVSAQQYFVKGTVMQNERFVTYTDAADGVFAEKLKNTYFCTYRPELYSLFNYLQPGRYNK